MIKEIEIGKLNDLLKKYPQLLPNDFQVDTPYGFHDIEWCGITEENAEVYRCELEDGKYVEGADYHRLKKEDGKFTTLKGIEVGTPIQIIGGKTSNVKSIELLEKRDTLYDIQVAKVQQYYSNDMVSHNTTFSVDAIKFLLFGRTTKTDKNEQIFNTYTDKNTLVVRGMFEIEGQETIIERKLSRSAKKSGGWTVVNKVNYYKLLPDGEEVLLNDEDSKKTSEVIKDNIGDETDFDITILATARNLEDLVDAKPTESGRLLTKFIGLEVIENKEIIAKQMNSDFNKTKKGNHYNVVSLLTDNTTNEENIKLYSDHLKTHKENLSVVESTIGKLDNEKDRL